MLPSGNDAAWSLAEFFGSLLQKCYIDGYKAKNNEIKVTDLKIKKKFKWPVSCFVYYMN